MDWARAVDINRIALTRIVAEIFALIGLVAGGALPHRLYLVAERMLRPTESALRRLIIIAARGLVLKPSVRRPMPQGLVFVAGAQRRMLFRLFDARKKFHFIEPENPWLVMVKTFSSNPFNPFEPGNQRRAQELADHDYTLRFQRRLAAVKQALETLPQQARRMARWQAKRKAMDKPKFTLPLRPGPPPGHSDKPKAEIDFVLTECHALAWDVLNEDSS